MAAFALRYELRPVHVEAGLLDPSHVGGLVGVVFAVAAAATWTQLATEVDGALGKVEEVLKNPPTAGTTETG